MHNAAAISAVYRALAHYRRRQAKAPTDHSAREIAQMSMLAEYLHETHIPTTLTITPKRAMYPLTSGPLSLSLPNRSGGRKGSRSLPSLHAEAIVDKTENILRNLLSALPAQGYDIGILSGSGMHRLEAVAASAILRMLPYLKHHNANGAHIFLRPTGENAYTLLDDLNAEALARLLAEGYGPAAVIETSPGSFQAWLRHAQPLPKELGTIAAKTLAAQFGADGGAADWRRFGRAPGFTNRKPQHRSAEGLFPFARLVSNSGQPFPLAATFRRQLDALHRKAEQERAAARLRFASHPVRFGAPVALSRFRASFRYAGRPAAADMAFCIAAVTQGWSESEIADALSRDYLSRDTSPLRRAAYIRRTLSKAVRWAA